MEQFKDVYVERQKALGSASSALPKAKSMANMLKDKEVMFQVALEAILRKMQQLQPALSLREG